MPANVSPILRFLCERPDAGELALVAGFVPANQSEHQAALRADAHVPGATSGR